MLRNFKPLSVAGNEWPSVDFEFEFSGGDVVLRTRDVMLALFVALAVGGIGPAAARDAMAEAYNADVQDLYKAGKYEEALPIAQKVLEIYEDTSGRDSDDVASALNNLAQLNQMARRYADVESLYKRALAITEKNSVPTAESLQSR